MNKISQYKTHGLSEEFFEEIIASSAPVYEIEWDCDNPGSGSGSEYVYATSHGYFVFSETEWWLGPFDNLLKAILTTELNFLYGTVTNIYSSELNTDLLKSILKSPHDEGYRFHLNGEPYKVNSSGCIEEVLV